jgi:pimeloyl-ACP methyl ester carboxylesterase
MQLVVDSLLTEYESNGVGRTILLLHGWGDDHHTFKQLQTSLKGFNTVALDLPGFGQTQAPQAIWTLDDYAKFISSFLGKTNLKPYAIIGHSNGGAVAIRGLAMGVLDCERLVLLAAAGVREGQSARRLVFKAIAKVGKATTFWLPQKNTDRIYAKNSTESLDRICWLHQSYKRHSSKRCGRMSKVMLLLLKSRRY